MPVILLILMKETKMNDVFPLPLGAWDGLRYTPYAQRVCDTLVYSFDNVSNRFGAISVIDKYLGVYGTNYVPLIADMFIIF